MPERIQRKRTKGWKMPEGAVYVGRPSKWGNPYEVVNGHKQGWLIYDSRENGSGYISAHATESEAKARAVRLCTPEIHYQSIRNGLAELTGRNLACWCPVGTPCHADVLLEVANP